MRKIMFRLALAAIVGLAMIAIRERQVILPFAAIMRTTGPDATLELTASNDKESLSVRDLITGEELGQFPHDAYRAVVAYNRNRKILALSGYCSRVVQVWDLSTNKELPCQSFVWLGSDWEDGGCEALAFTSDGETLIARTDCKVACWDVKSWKKIADCGLYWFQAEFWIASLAILGVVFGVGVGVRAIVRYQIRERRSFELMLQTRQQYLGEEFLSYLAWREQPQILPQNTN